MRCPRCFYEVPVDADRCPKCKLATPKVQQSGVSTGITGQYAASQTKTQAKVKKTAPGKTGQLSRTQAQPGLKLSRWQLVAIFGGVLAASGALGYGISEYRFWNTPPPNAELGALHLVERARSSRGGTIGEALTADVVRLVEDKKVDELEGWRVECQESKCKVTYTVKLVGQEIRTAVWEVDLAAKTVSPQNRWAQDLTK